jgi:hypothetical protein
VLVLEVEGQERIERRARLALVAQLGLEVGTRAREPQQGGVLADRLGNRAGDLGQSTLLAPQHEQR